MTSRRTIYYKDKKGHRVSIEEPQPKGAMLPPEKGPFYLIAIKCENCRRTIPKRTRWQKFCSDSCRVDAWRTRNVSVSDKGGSIQHSEDRESSEPAKEVETLPDGTLG